MARVTGDWVEKNPPEAETCASAEAETGGAGTVCPTPVFGTQPPAGPANLQACRYHHKRKTWLRIHDGVTTRDFRLILGLGNAIKNMHLRLISWLRQGLGTQYIFLWSLISYNTIYPYSMIMER